MLLSYFTCESTNRKVDWLRDLNWSHHGSLKSGLMCSFNDKELSEFIPAKKRCGGPLPTKQAVTHVGRQEDGLWVLNENIIVSASGVIVKEDSPYTWIGHLTARPGIAKPSDAINIPSPLDNKAVIRPLINALQSVLQHNFLPEMMLLGACAMSLHYEAMLDQ